MDRSRPISPVFVILLGVMSAAVVLTVYHCIVVTWCSTHRRGRRSPSGSAAARADIPAEGESMEFSAMQLIPPAVKYVKDEGMVSADQTTCAVCLSDFKDGETVRLLPECLHCFHAPCIDMWLRSHTNCPMCRTETSPILNTLQNQTEAVTPGAADLGVRIPVIVNARLPPTIAY